jgi:steroid delta-isomerase-like uncharacterized protein
MEYPEPAISTLLATQIGAIWSDGRIELVDSLYAEAIIDHMPVAGQVGGRAGLKQAVEMFRAAMPDLRMTLHGTIGCGDIGVDWWTLEGTQSGELFGLPPTGRSVRFGGIDWVRVKAGQIAELWHIEEMFQMEQQLGIGAANSFGAPVDPAFAAAASSTTAGASARLPDENRLSAIECRNLQVARRHIEGLWAAGDTSVADEVYAADVIDMNPAPGQRPGIAGILDVLGWLREAAPDLRMQINAYAVSGDHAADRWTMTGTHTGADLLGQPAQGRSFVMEGMDVVRIGAQGRIDRVWHVEDLAALARQI